MLSNGESKYNFICYLNIYEYIQLIYNVFKCESMNRWLFLNVYGIKHSQYRFRFKNTTKIQIKPKYMYNNPYVDDSNAY